MKIYKIISLILSLVMICNFFCGCGEEKDYVLYFELNEEPKTLDPQLVSSTSEKVLVRNLFEGLTRIDKEGNVVNGLAESINQSKDGLTYTIKIKDALWSNGDTVSAEDFVFAFKRAVSPDTLAPDVSMLYCIENAEEINKGNSNLNLGVTVIDSSTLEIKLKEKTKNFTEILTYAICMPCHQNTFNEAKGKYGLDADNLVTNGSFKLRLWEKGENFSLRINRFDEYIGGFNSHAASVIFNKGEMSGRAARIKESNVDFGFINFAEAENDINLVSFKRTTYALLINKNSDIGNLNFRKAFEKSIHRNRLSNELDKNLSVTDTLLPDIIGQNGLAISNNFNNSFCLEYNPNEAHQLYLRGVKEAGAPKTATIIYFGDDSVTKMAGIIAEGFQQSLGSVVNIKKAKTENELFGLIKSNDYQLALCPIYATTNSPIEFCGQFTSKGSNNIYGYSNKNYDALVGSITPTSTEEQILKTTEKALNVIAESHSIIPIAQYAEGFGYSKNYTAPPITPFNGVIDLAQIKQN